MTAEQRKRLPADERKKQIMEVALKLFAKKGFEETKTKEIAVEVGISEAAMFKLFKNKQELIMMSLDYKFSVHKKEHKETFIPILENQDTVPDDVLKSIGLKAYEMIENNIDLVRVMMYSILKHPEETRHYLKCNMEEDERVFKKIAKEGIKNGKIKNLDPDIIGPVFPIMMLGLAIGNYLIEGKTGNKKQREKFVNTMVEVYLRGILK